MKALSCDAQATSLPPRRETTTLLVPTSMPTGCEPRLHEVLDLLRRRPPAPSRGGPCSPPFALSSACVRAAARGASALAFAAVSASAGLLGEPAVVGLASSPGAASSGERPAAAASAASCRSACGDAGPRLAHARRGSARRSRSRTARTAGDGPLVLVGQAEGGEREAARPVEVVADQVLLRVDAGEAVGHAHLGLDRPLLAQVVGEAAPGLELRAGDRQRAARPPSASRTRRRSWARSGSGTRGRPALHTDMPAWLALSVSSTTRNTWPKRSIR